MCAPCLWVPLVLRTPGGWVVGPSVPEKKLNPRRGGGFFEVTGLSWSRELRSVLLSDSGAHPVPRAVSVLWWELPSPPRPCEPRPGVQEETPRCLGRRAIYAPDPLGDTIPPCPTGGGVGRMGETSALKGPSHSVPPRETGWSLGPTAASAALPGRECGNGARVTIASGGGPAGGLICVHMENLPQTCLLTFILETGTCR